jgi:hypothetical protein
MRGLRHRRQSGDRSPVRRKASGECQIKYRARTNERPDLMTRRHWWSLSFAYPLRQIGCAFAAAALVASIPATAISAETAPFDNGFDLARRCESNDSAEKLFCVSFLSGVYTTAIALGELVGPPVLCPRGSVSGADLLGIFQNYARSNSQHLDTSPAVTALLAFRNAVGCPNGPVQSRLRWNEEDRWQSDGAACAGGRLMRVSTSPSNGSFARSYTITPVKKSPRKPQNYSLLVIGMRVMRVAIYARVSTNGKKVTTDNQLLSVTGVTTASI